MTQAKSLPHWFFVLLGSVQGQGIGDGIAKSTYASSDPIRQKNFMEKYFPVVLASDDCEIGQDSICHCSAPSGWSWDNFTVQQGRLQLGTDEGFGFHLVDKQASVTTGAISVSTIESIFTTRLAGLESFDHFLDYNVGLYHRDLDNLLLAFEAASVAYLPFTWSTTKGFDLYGVYVHVPGSQMVLELLGSSNLLKGKSSQLTRLETRMSARSLAYAKRQVNNVTVVNVRRAASNITAVDDFYGSNGMQTQTTLDIAENSTSAKCYLWSGAEVEICFVEREVSSQSGIFDVAAFEDMLWSAHNTILVGHPNCARDKWTDNHYAYDTQDNLDYIVHYLNEHPDVPFLCDGSSLHMITDPTGWSIQLDGSFTIYPQSCNASAWVENLEPDYSCFLGVCGADISPWDSSASALSAQKQVQRLSAVVSQQRLRSVPHAISSSMLTVVAACIGFALVAAALTFAPKLTTSYEAEPLISHGKQIRSSS